MNKFIDTGYIIIRKAISKTLADFIYQYFNNKRKVARLLFDSGSISESNQDWGHWNDPFIPKTYSHYGDLVMETLLETIQPIMEKQVDYKLNPNYTYARIYKKGDELPRHKDRWSCEISVTMNLGGDPWEFFVDPTGGGRHTEDGYEMGTAKGNSVILKPGDMLMYQGAALEHWREPFEGENCGQVFLHFNDARKGTTNIYDGRPFLGLPLPMEDYLLT